MKNSTRFLIILILSAAAWRAIGDQVPLGLVYGPKAAFNIAAPEGWVIDNSAGAGNGLPCVLYRKGQTWETADPLMYAKIASTTVEEAEPFVRTAIEEMKKERGDYKVKRIEAGKTKDGRDYFINEYSPNQRYPRIERVAYVQLPKAVAYIVYSGDHEALFRKHQVALKQLLDCFTYLEPKPQ